LRTVFLSGRDSGSAEGILPRLNQCINGSTDTDLYSNASALLTAAKKKYKPDRGSGGRLEQLQNQRKSAERELRLCLASKEAAEADEKEKENAEKKLAEIRRRLELANAYAQALLQQSAYEEFCQQAKQAETTLGLFEEQHGPRPTEELLEHCRKLLERIRSLRRETETEPFSEKEKSEFLKLQDCFDRYPTNREELDRMENKLQELQDAGINYRQANAILESEEYINMRLTEQAVMKDEEATLLVANYSEKRSKVEELLANPNMDRGELAKAGQELQEAEHMLDHNKLIAKMQETNDAFTDMMKKVNKIIKKVVTGEDEEEEEHGCTGSCSSCGGGCGHHH